MKKIFLYAALLGVFACNNNKAEREAEIEAATQAAIDSVNAITERERLNDSMSVPTTPEPTVSAAPVPENKKTPARTRKGTGDNKPGTAGTPGKTNEGTAGSEPVPTGTANTGNDNSTVNTGTTSTGEADEPEVKKKKGINNTVKGAIIGAGAGAVGGAIINKKNPGKGAIIGGVVGAGAGAVTGVILDKNKKKKEAAKDSAGKTTTTKEPAPTGTTNP